VTKRRGHSKSDRPQKGRSKKQHRSDGGQPSGRGGDHRRSGGFQGRQGNDRRFPDRSADRPGPRDPIAILNEAVQNQAAEQSRERIKSWLSPVAAPGPKDRGFDLDPWQKQAFDHLMDGHSVIVDAPTTAGKTRVVEAFFHANIGKPNFRAAYTTPVKSLSNDKLREFRAMFGVDKVGISTGDIKENLDAPIVVATLESYRNSLLGLEPDLHRHLVVFDEYHYLQDSSRGSAWEEAIILTPPNCQLLLLSASVQNATEFCEWLASIKGHGAEIIEVKKRPVPLVDLIWSGDKWYVPETLPTHVLKNQDGHRDQFPPEPQLIARRIVAAEPYGLTPAIIYAGRRLACEAIAGALLKILKPLSPEDSQRIGEVLNTSHEVVKALTFIPSHLRRMLQTYGIGFHHSGLAPPARIAIENLVKQGLLRYCVATMGLSIGINFAVRSALIADYSRPGDTGHTDYPTSEVLQMLGRAGRRGRDHVGFSLWPSVESYQRLARPERESIDSRLRNDPITYLGLAGQNRKPEAIEEFYSKSFRHFRDGSKNLHLIRKERLKEQLRSNGARQEMPCHSPAAEVVDFWLERPSSICLTCPLKNKCHPLIEAEAEGDLAALHLHLHAIGALTKDEALTPYGSIARYFPQSGGLLIARMVSDGSITEDNLLRAAELMASLSLAHYKEHGATSAYRFPFDDKDIRQSLEDLYPLELFPEVYDAGGPNRHHPVFRDFNPAAGYIIREWIKGASWNELVQEVATEHYGPGDIMAICYRVATYLQSLAGCSSGPLAQSARTLRASILREPLAFAITAGS